MLELFVSRTSVRIKTVKIFVARTVAKTKTIKFV